MSVEQKLIRLAPTAFESLQQNPTRLPDLIEDHYELDYFDSRSIHKGPIHFGVPVPRMIHIDKFTIWLLTDRYEYNALCDAVVAWRDTQELIGAPHGHFFAFASYQTPEAVRRVARGLQRYPQRELTKRFLSQAELFRQAAASSIGGDDAILAYQRGFFAFLQRFYREAAQQKEYMLHLIV